MNVAVAGGEMMDGDNQGPSGGRSRGTKRVISGGGVSTPGRDRVRFGKA